MILSRALLIVDAVLLFAIALGCLSALLAWAAGAISRDEQS